MSARWITRIVCPPAEPRSLSSAAINYKKLWTTYTCTHIPWRHWAAMKGLVISLVEIEFLHGSCRILTTSMRMCVWREVPQLPCFYPSQPSFAFFRLLCPYFVPMGPTPRFENPICGSYTSERQIKKWKKRLLSYCCSRFSFPERCLHNANVYSRLFVTSGAAVCPSKFFLWSCFFFLSSFLPRCCSSALLRGSFMCSFKNVVYHREDVTRSHSFPLLFLLEMETSEKDGALICHICARVKAKEMHAVGGAVFSPGFPHKS